MGGLSILCAVGCGVPDQVFVQLQGQSRVAGGFYSQGQTVEFWAENPAPLVADVKLLTDGLRFDAHFDYAAGVVVLDGHGGALDQPLHALLAHAVEARALSIGAELADLPLEQKALYTALVSWEQSGGIALSRLSISLARDTLGARAALALDAPSAPEAASGEAVSGEAASGEAVRCVSRGQSYAVSYAAGSSVIDEIAAADTWDCNGSCSPGCLQLTPAPMWTLACLAYDACCRASGGAADCWDPQGECAGEYAQAMADFVRGLDPNASHCPG